MHDIRAAGTFALALALVACGSRPAKYLAKGNQLFDQQKYAESALNYRKALQGDNNYGEAYYRLGLAEAALKHTDLAYAALDRAVQLMPQNVDAKVRLADLLLIDYQATRAPDSYEKVTRIADELTSRDARSFPGLRLKGYLALADGKPSQAAQLFQEANAVQPFVPDVVITWVQSLILDGHAADAEQLARKLIAVHPDAGPIYDTLYGYYLETGRVGDAERILLTKVENNPNDSFPVTQLASHYWQHGRQPQARQALERLLGNPKRFPQPYLTIGGFYQQHGYWDDALDAFAAGAAANPADKLIYQKRTVQTLLAAGKRAQALEVLAALLLEHPGDDDLAATRATLLVDDPQADRRQEALHVLENLVRKSPMNLTARYQLGRAYASSHRYSDAREQMDAVVKQQPDNVPAWLALAEIASKTQDYAACERYADQVLALAPSQRSARLLKASVLLRLGDFDRARSAYNELLRAYPDYREAKLQLALLNVLEGRYADADKAFRANYDPGQGDFRSMEGLILMYYSQGRTEQALELVQAQSARYPSSFELRQMNASLAAQAGKWDASVREYEALAADKKDDPGILLALGDAYRHAGDLQKAAATLERAQTLRPSEWRTAFLLGFVYQLGGQTQKAEAEYKQCLQLNPDHPDTLNNLAFLVAADDRRLDEALTIVKQAVQASDGSVESADTMGWIYYRQGHLDTAAKIFSGLIAKNPANSMLHYHFGLVLKQKGDRTGANRELLLAVKQGLPPAEKNAANRLLIQN